MSGKVGWVDGENVALVTWAIFLFLLVFLLEDRQREYKKTNERGTWCVECVMFGERRGRMDFEIGD